MLYDGICYFCNWLVRFALRVDTGRQLLFASLRPAPGQALLRSQGVPAGDIDTALLIDNGRVLFRTTQFL